MVATTYGDSTLANIIFCTHYTGAHGHLVDTPAASEAPDTSQGTLVYLVTPDIEGAYKNLMKWKEISGGSSYAMWDGKRDWPISNNDIFVAKYGAVSTNTEAFNQILNQFKAWTKIGASPIYLFFKNITDNKYLCLGANASCSEFNNYLKGGIQSFPWKIGEGNIYYFKSITFKETTIG